MTDSHHNSLLIAAILYGCALELTQSEVDTVSHITQPALMATVISNDIDSYPREVRETQAAGKTDGVPNSVWILERLQGMSVKQAMAKLLDLRRGLESEYLAKKQAYFEEHPDVKKDMFLYLEFIAYMSSGNSYWGTGADRYQDKSGSHDVQIADGEPEYDKFVGPVGDEVAGTKHADAEPAGDKPANTSFANGTASSTSPASDSHGH